MVPTILALGAAAGALTGRVAWLFVPLSGLAWTLGIDAGVPGWSVAAANAAAGVGLGAALRWAVVGLVRRALRSGGGVGAQPLH